MTNNRSIKPGGAGFRPNLPFEPRVFDEPRQARLVATHLLPVLPELEAFFLAVRCAMDPLLQRANPVKLGKPYPLGQCLEITLAVQKLLRNLNVAALAPAARRGHAAFTAFLAAGGGFRHVWGDLRGEFFQNAFLIGTLYLDVANDTVTVSKPKVEILPFADCGLSAIRDCRHFAQLAARYWKDTVVPNHVVPELAPYFPLLHANVQGVLRLRDDNAYMLELVRTGQFTPAEEMLSGPPMPVELFEQATRLLAGSGLSLATSPEAGRVQALRHCREYRAKRWYGSSLQVRKFAALLDQANKRLMA